MSYPLVRVRRRSGGPQLDLESFARATDLHPELLRRWVALGLLDPEQDAAGGWCFGPAELATVARIQRLRAGLCLNYAAVGLVIELLDRIAELESTPPRWRPSRGG